MLLTMSFVAEHIYNEAWKYVTYHTRPLRSPRACLRETAPAKDEHAGFMI